MSDKRTRGPDRRDYRRKVSFPLRLESGEIVEADRRHGFDPRRLGFLSRLDLFADAAFAAVEPIIADCPIRELAAGEVLMTCGEINESLFIVVEGHLEVQLAESAARECIGVDVGGCVGELSIVDGEPVSATVVATEPTQVLVLSSEVMWRRLVLVDPVARNLLRVLSGRTREVKNRMLELRERQLEYQRLQEQLALARDIQTSMLPERGRLRLARPELDCVAITEPASEVGGDFFDVFFLEDDRLFFAVGDVSGKGVAAALLMSRTMGMLRSEMLAGRTLADAVRRLNAALCVNNERCHFVTGLAGVLDLASGEVDYVNAGHLPPILCGAAGVTVVEDQCRGPCLGILDGAPYGYGRLRLRPGERLLVYSDGLLDAEGAACEPFGLERVIALLGDDGSGDPAAMVDGLVAAVAEHVGSAQAIDDLTLLAVGYRGAGNED